jgi:hypothetical protein
MHAFKASSAKSLLADGAIHVFRRPSHPKEGTVAKRIAKVSALGARAA